MLDYFLKKAVGPLGIKLGNIGLGFAVTVALANILNSHEFGVYTYAFSVAALLSIPAKFGLQKLIVRETSKANVHNNWALIKGLWQWAFLTVIALSLLSSAIYLGVIFLLDPDKRSLYSEVWGYAVWFIPLMAIASIRVGVLVGLRQIWKAHFPEQIIRPLIFLVALFVCLHVYSPVNAKEAIFSHLLAWFVVFLIGLVLLKNECPREIKEVKKVSYQYSYWIKSVIPLGLTSIMFQINTYADIFLLGYWVSPDKIGDYRIAVQFALLMAIGMQVVEMFMSPIIAKLYAEEKLEKLKRLVSISSAMSFMLALVVYVFLWLFGELLIEKIFTEEYRGAFAILMILGIGQILSALFGSQGPLAAMTGNEKSAAKCLMMSAVLNIVLNLIFIPMLGVVGAAYATVISMAFKNLFLWLVLLRATGINSMALVNIKG
ncbi:flippase [Neptuniibacter sp. PT34_22]|uniref:flippase n=1 Tax=Neptuniibacter sp. PT34_22 TaxID=3398205 RepID=UPI0039F4E7B3